MNIRTTLLLGLLLFLFSGYAYAINVPSCTINIASSGYYSLTNDLNASNVSFGGCLNVTGVNIVLDLGGWRIENATRDGVAGVYLTGNTSNITIMNGTIRNLTGLGTGAVYYQTSTGFAHNGSVANMTFSNVDTAIFFGQSNVTVTGITVFNSTTGLLLGDPVWNITVNSGTLRDSGTAISIPASTSGGFISNISFSHLYIYNNTNGTIVYVTDGSNAALLNMTQYDVRYENNSRFDLLANHTNELYLTYVLFNYTNISANFTGDALFRAVSVPVSADAPLQYNLSYFINISNVTKVLAGPVLDPSITLTFHYKDSDIPSGADESTLTMYEYAGSAWNVVTSSSLNSNANTVTGYLHSLRIPFNQYGLFLSAGAPQSARNDDDGGNHRIQRALDPIPFDYVCDNGHFAVQTMAGAKVHVSQVCDPACGRIEGGVACSFDESTKVADENGVATFGGNGYYYVHISQSSDDFVRDQDDYEACFASCSRTLPGLYVETRWFCDETPDAYTARVTDAQGNPLEGATVIIRGVEGGPAVSTVMTGADGMAVFDNVPAEAFSVEATKEDYTMDRIDFTPSPCPHTFDYSLNRVCPGGDIRLTVTDHTTGAPVAGADVDYDFESKVTDANGQAVYQVNPHPQDHYLDVRKDGYDRLFVDGANLPSFAACPPPVVVPPVQEPGTSPGGEPSATPDACNSLSISSNVAQAFVGDVAQVIVDCDGKHAQNQEVVITRPGGAVIKSTTDQNGALTLPLEFQGTYSLEVGRSGQVSDTTTITVQTHAMGNNGSGGNIFTYLTSDPIRASLTILVLGVALILAYLYLRSTKSPERPRLRK